MELTHTFTVPTSVEEAWAHFNDIASVAECFPGATVTSVEEESFHGSVKVKLGPIALLYNGSGTFVEKDEAAHRFVVDAKGRDKRGNGTAGATVTLTMAGSGESTDVEVVTDLAITGKPAQFGRGVMQDVSDKLLGQFIACLEQRLNTPEPEAAVTVAEEAPAPVAAAVTAAAGVPTDETVVPEPEKQQDRPWVPAPTAPAASAPAASRPVADDSIDLGATVLPVLARTYWKQGLGLLAVVVLIWWWVSGRD